MENYSSDAKPMVPWIGGKRRLAKDILPMFPAHDCYVEPFAGAAALFFLKPPAKVEVLNDVNGDMVNLYRVVQHHLEEFIKQFQWALRSREMFGLLKTTRPETLTDIQRAARFFYLQKNGFGGVVDSTTFGVGACRPVGINLLRLEEELSAVHLRLHLVTIERMDWAACVKRYDRDYTLFYMDPPYWGTKGYGVGFELDQFALMAEMARTMKGKVVISVNDIPEMRQAFDGLTIKALSTRYTVGGNAAARRSANELLISNF